MKYGLGIKILISFLVGSIAVLYKIKLDPKNNTSQVSELIDVPNDLIFNFVTKPSNVPSFFSWIRKFEELDPRKNLTFGKAYKGKLDLPFLGQHEVRYNIKDLEPGRWIVLKPDVIRGSYFNPEILLMFNSITPTQSHFFMKITYHRTSALFQLTLGALLKSITDTQLENLGARVKSLTMLRWDIKRNLPISKSTENVTKSESRVEIRGAEADPSRVEL